MNLHKVSFSKEPIIIKEFDSLFNTKKIKWYLKDLSYQFTKNGFDNYIACISVSEFLDLKTNTDTIKNLCDSDNDFIQILKKYFLSILDVLGYSYSERFSLEELNEDLPSYVNFSKEHILLPVYSFRSMEFGQYVLLNMCDLILNTPNEDYKLILNTDEEKIFSMILEKEQNYDKAEFIKSLMNDFKEIVLSRENFLNYNNMMFSYQVKKNLDYCTNDFNKIKQIFNSVFYELRREQEKKRLIELRKENEAYMREINRRKEEEEKKDKGKDKGKDRGKNNDKGISF